MDVEGELLCLAHEHWVREILESEIRDNRTAVVVHTAVLERVTELKGERCRCRLSDYVEARLS